MILTAVLQIIFILICVVFFFLNRKNWQKKSETNKDIIVKIIISFTAVVVSVLVSLIIVIISVQVMKVLNSPFLADGGITLKIAKSLIYLVSTVFSVIFFYYQYGKKSFILDAIYIPAMYFILSEKILFLFLFPIACGFFGDCI